MQLMYRISDNDANDTYRFLVEVLPDGGLSVGVQFAGADEETARFTISAQARERDRGMMTMVQGEALAAEAVRFGRDSGGWTPPFLVSRAFLAELREGEAALRAACLDGDATFARVAASKASAEARKIAAAAKRPVLHAWAADEVEIVVLDDPEWPCLLYLDHGDMGHSWTGGQLPPPSKGTAAPLPPVVKRPAGAPKTIAALLDKLTNGDNAQFLKAREQATEIARTDAGFAELVAAIDARAQVDSSPDVTRGSEGKQECFQLVRVAAKVGTPQAWEYLQTLVPPKAAAWLFQHAAGMALMSAPHGVFDTQWLRRVSAMSPDPMLGWGSAIERAREHLRSSRPRKAPAKKPAKQPAKKPAKQPGKKPAKQPGKKPAKQPAKKPAKQPGKKSASARMPTAL